MKRTYLIFFLMVSVFHSCSLNSEDDLTDNIVVNVVNYEDNIKSIIDNNCNSCHNNPPVNGAPMSLTSYNNVIEAKTNNSNQL